MGLGVGVSAAIGRQRRGTAVAGVTAYARSFAKASSQSLDVANNATLQVGGGNFTFAAWYKVASVELMTLAGHGWAVSPEWMVGLRTDRIDGQAWNGSGSQVASKLLAMSASAWVFVLLQYVHATRTLSIDANNSGTPASVVISGSGIPAGTDAFTFGKTLQGFGYFNGLIDSATLLKRTLSAADKSWLYNAGAGRRYAEADAAFKTSMVSWWDMEGTSGETDKHGSNNLTASASAPTRVVGLA